MKLSYTLSIEQPAMHYAHVEVKVEGLQQETKTIRAVMPIWTPGSYLVMEFSKNVSEFQARNAVTGAPLAVEKTAKNIWEITTEGAEQLLISYSVYAFEYTVDTSYIDTEHAVINGASIFVYIDGAAGEPFTLKIKKPRGWTKVTTSLEPVGGAHDEPVFSVPNFDTLIDSPIQIGNQRVHEFSVRGVPHFVSVFSPFTINEKPLVESISRIAEKAVEVFDHVPYDRYYFIVEVLGEGGGGLEHLKSTHCMTTVFDFYSSDDFKRSLSLYSHEFFHAWNVKRMRPLGLGPFDYTREVYTKSLWVAEGITDYYDDLLVRRAGLYEPAEYLDRLAFALSQMIALPGSRYQSAQESSFDSWVKYYRREQTDPNRIMSYYTQGAAIGMCLDLSIRRNTGGSKTLDDVMRKVYKETYLSSGSGYTDEQFEDACVEFGGRDAEEVFEKRVKGREALDYSRYLSFAGLTLVPKEKTETQGFIGVSLRGDGVRTVVEGVLEGYPAQLAGISKGDEILAVDGIRTDVQKLGSLIRAMGPRRTIRVLLAGKGGVRTAELETANTPVLEYRVQKTETATDEEKAIYRGWIGADWSAPLVYRERKEIYVRPGALRPFDYI